jgi:23S rRNA U2552 (ribose-2'-O)-methylase RlmE/FtsJ
MRDIERAHQLAMRGVYEHYAIQKVDELTFILSLTEKDDTIVEIGCDAGGTSWAIKEFGVGRYIGLDLPGTDYSSGLAWMGEPTTTMVWGDSHDKRTKEKLLEVLEGDTIDFLIIDGDHSYTGVADDFRMYASLCTGLVVFHDICFHQEQPSCQVDKYWKEIQKRYPHTEFISPHNDVWGGVGVLDLSWSSRLKHACT